MPALERHTIDSLSASYAEIVGLGITCDFSLHARFHGACGRVCRWPVWLLFIICSRKLPNAYAMIMVVCAGFLQPREKEKELDVQPQVPLLQEQRKLRRFQRSGK